LITLKGFPSANSAELYATVTPANATNKNVVWSSNNEAVATVSDTGLVHVDGISPGTAIITATTEDGGFTATCMAEVIELDVQRAIPRHSSDMKEVVAKMPGFSEDDFEIVGGNVVIKKSIVETIAKKLLGTNNFEIFLVPSWFEAAFQKNDQNGKIAAVDLNMIISSAMLSTYLDYEKEYFLSITSPNTGEFLKIIGEGADFGDGEFTFSLSRFGLGRPVGCELTVLIRDGGKFDINKTENGLIIGQLAIIGKGKLKEDQTNQNKSGSGCNAVYGGTLLLLSGSLMYLRELTKKNLRRE
jgi:hypothetical protein